MTTTLISGGNRGLGLATGRALAAAGQTVFLGTRHLDQVLAAAADVGATGVQLDVTDTSSVEAALERVEQEAGGLDVLSTTQERRAPRAEIFHHLRKRRSSCISIRRRSMPPPQVANRAVVSIDASCSGPHAEFDD